MQILNKNGEAVLEVYDAANNASWLSRDFNNSYEEIYWFKVWLLTLYFL